MRSCSARPGGSDQAPARPGALYNLACDGLLSGQLRALVGTALEDLSSRGVPRAHEHRDQEIPYPARSSIRSRGTSWSSASTTSPAASPKGARRSGQAEGRGRQARHHGRREGKRAVLLRDRAEVLRRAVRHAARHRLEAGAGVEAHHRRKAVRHVARVGARVLNREVLAHWDETQIYRVDHYLGKETVQNLLAFRFSNGMFEPLWNKHYIDNIQFNVSEAVDVEGRGGYYDSSGVLRDMMQNHMFQMLAYLCMEVPGSFEPDAIRNEKAKLLQSVRRYSPEEVDRYAVRGQYGPSLSKPGYRQETGVSPTSTTETYAAARFHIDELALGGRAGSTPALGQGLVEARHRDRRRVQEGARGDVPRHRGHQPRREPHHLSHPAVPGHRGPVPGQDPRAAPAAAAGAHEVRLRRRVQGVALHRLRGDAVLVLARRRDAVLAR